MEQIFSFGKRWNVPFNLASPRWMEHFIFHPIKIFVPLHSHTFIISSGVSHSDGSCVLGRIHSDVSSNIPKKVYHIVTDNFVNLLHISYAWLYETECWGRKFHAFSFNSHRNCKLFMTNFNFIFDTICVPYIFRKSIFGWNCDHDTPLCDTPLLEDTPLCDTPDDLYTIPHQMEMEKGLKWWVSGAKKWPERGVFGGHIPVQPSPTNGIQQ